MFSDKDPKKIGLENRPRKLILEMGFWHGSGGKWSVLRLMQVASCEDLEVKCELSNWQKMKWGRDHFKGLELTIFVNCLINLEKEVGSQLVHT